MTCKRVRCQDIQYAQQSCMQCNRRQILVPPVFPILQDTLTWSRKKEKPSSCRPSPAFPSKFFLHDRHAPSKLLVYRNNSATTSEQCQLSQPVLQLLYSSSSHVTGRLSAGEYMRVCSVGGKKLAHSTHLLRKKPAKHRPVYRQEDGRCHEGSPVVQIFNEVLMMDCVVGGVQGAWEVRVSRGIHHLHGSRCTGRCNVPVEHTPVPVQTR